jgi:hypothetical protein
MEHNIAFCVATYNHPATVNDVLARTVSIYDKYGIDIYMFDSSESDETRNIVEKYQACGGSNLYYVRLDSAMISAEKVLYIFSGKGFKKHYEYIFLLKDRVAFEEVTISLIAAESHKGYDAIILPTAHFPYDVCPQPKREVYTNAAELFRDYGIYAPDWQTTLLRYDTLLKNVDWDAFKAGYFIDGNNNFVQMLTLYNGLAALDKVSVRVLRETELFGYESNFSTSLWMKSKYNLWAQSWPKIVDMLSDCYDDYKPLVKKKEGMQPALFGSPYTLVADAKKGGLTRETMTDIEPMWAEVSDIPYECLGYIIDERYDLMMKRLYVEWYGLFMEQRFPEAYHMYYCNEWIKEVIGKESYDALGKCFEIYREELSRGSSSTIFDDVRSASEAVNKYRSLTEKQ